MVPGANLEDLHDMRLLAGAEGGDGRGHRLGIGAAEDGRDDIVGLALVEDLRDQFELLAQLAAHGVPPGDFGLCEGRRSAYGARERGGQQKCGSFHGSSFPVDDRCRWRLSWPPMRRHVHHSKALPGK
jgi:hypothetical protein